MKEDSVSTVKQRDRKVNPSGAMAMSLYLGAVFKPPFMGEG